MVLPTRVLPEPGRYSSSMEEAIREMFDEFGYSVESIGREGDLAVQLADRVWYPLPIRARCTLTVEGSLDLLTGSP
jgi:hypothetical protein